MSVFNSILDDFSWLLNFYYFPDIPSYVLIGLLFLLLLLFLVQVWLIRLELYELRRLFEYEKNHQRSSERHIHKQLSVLIDEIRTSNHLIAKNSNSANSQNSNTLAKESAISFSTGNFNKTTETAKKNYSYIIPEFKAYQFPATQNKSTEPNKTTGYEESINTGTNIETMNKESNKEFLSQMLNEPKEDSLIKSPEDQNLAYNNEETETNKPKLQIIDGGQNSIDENSTESSEDYIEEIRKQMIRRINR